MRGATNVPPYGQYGLGLIEFAETNSAGDIFHIRSSRMDPFAPVRRIPNSRIRMYCDALFSTYLSRRLILRAVSMSFFYHSPET